MGSILAACYLINRMPSFVLYDLIPHSIIFPNQPLFYLPPVSLIVSVLFIFLLLGKTSSLPKQLSLSSWVIFEFKRVLDNSNGLFCLLLSQIDTSSLLMSLSLRISFSSPL